MKLTLSSTNNTYNLAPLNANFDAIEEEFQNKVLYRDNPVGEPNHMEQDLDLNNYNLLNVNQLHAVSLRISGRDLSGELISAADEAYNWAQHPEDTPVPEGTGTEYSSYHYSLKASDSASSAASSLTDSETARDASQLALYNFEGTWYGVLSSEPTADPNGDPITDGDIYVNDSDGIFYFYNGGVWNPLGGDVVGSIFGRTGFVVAEAGDYDATQIDFSNATSGLTATNVQSAINEIEARTDAAESDINSLESTTVNIAPSIKSGDFDPEVQDLVWSGSSAGVASSLLSETGPGIYIVRTSLADYSMYVSDADSGSEVQAGSTFVFGGQPHTLWLTQSLGDPVFSVNRFNADGTNNTVETITAIFKV